MDTKTKKIGENTYYVRPFPPLDALSLLGDLQAVVTTDLNGEQVTSAQILGAIGKNLNGASLVRFANRILDKEFIAVQRKGESEPVRLDIGVQESLYTGNISEMLQVMWFVLEVNYTDFLELLKNPSGFIMG